MEYYLLLAIKNYQASFITIPQYTPLSPVVGPSHPLPARRLSKDIASLYTY